MSRQAHLRYLYRCEGLSRPSLCGYCPARWEPCEMPSKFDGLCPWCAAIARAWKRYRDRPVRRFALARAAEEEERP